MEQELPAGLGERQVAKFIEHDQVMSGQVLHQPAAPVVELLLLQLVHQKNSGGGSWQTRMAGWFS